MMRYLLALIALIIAEAIFFWYTKPTYDGVQSIRDESTQYDQALAKAAELQALKTDLLNKYKSFSPTDLDHIQKLLPDHVDNVALILDLDNLAAKYQMPIQNVDVSTPASGGGNDTTGLATIGASGQKYDSVTIHFNTSGTYQNFQTLMEELEHSLRIVDLVGLNLGPDTSNAAPGMYTYDVTLRTYWLK
jgi:hypothetical protein